MKNQTMKELYNEWRMIANEFVKEEGTKAYDCGEESCQEDFSKYVGRVVEFEEMFDLEKEWDQENL